MLWSLINLFFYPIVTVLSNMHLVYTLTRYNYTPGMMKDSVLRRCNEAFSESVAQFCIQLMILQVTWPVDNDVEPSQILSILTSFLSISSGSASWFCLVSGNDKPGILVTISTTLIYSLILAPRLFAAALILSYERQIGVIVLVTSMIISFLILLTVNRRWNSHRLDSRKEYVIHSIFDSIAGCSFLGNIFWGNVINVAIQGFALLLLPFITFYDITPLKDCTIPIYSRFGFLLNSTLNGSCSPFVDVCWNKTSYHVIYPLEISVCKKRDESHLLLHIMLPTFVGLILTLIPAKALDHLEEIRKNNTWLESLEMCFKSICLYIVPSMSPSYRHSVSNNAFQIKCIDSNLVIEYGSLGVHLREPRNVEEQLWFWRDDQLINVGRNIPLSIDGEYLWTFLNGILIGRRMKCSLSVPRKNQVVPPTNGSRLSINANSIDNVQFWESNDINDTFFGTSQYKFLLPSFSSNSELICFANKSQNEDTIHQDPNSLNYRSVLLPLWFDPISFFPCTSFNNSIMIVKFHTISVMRNVGIYEDLKIEYFEENGRKSLQGIVATQEQLFVIGGRYYQGRRQPTSTQILTSDLTWMEGPKLPHSFKLPVIHRCGTTLIVIDSFFIRAYAKEDGSSSWSELPTPRTKRYEFGSFILNRILYIVGGHRNVEGEENFTQYIQSCEYLDLDNPTKGWDMLFSESQLPQLLSSSNITLGPTFATELNDHTAIIGGLNTRKLFIFQNNEFSLIHGEDLQYDSFNIRHHKLVKWPF